MECEIFIRALLLDLSEISYNTSELLKYMGSTGMNLQHIGGCFLNFLKEEKSKWQNPKVQLSFLIHKKVSVS